MTLSQQFEQIGFEKGHVEGKAEGSLLEKRMLAKKMVSSGFGLEKVIELTDLPQEEIEIMES